MPKTANSAILLCLTFLSLSSAAQTPPDKGAITTHAASQFAYSSTDSLESRVEHFLRYSYGWGDLFEVKVGAPKPSSFPELQEVSVTVTVQGQTDTATVFVDKNGKLL